MNDKVVECIYAAVDEVNLDRDGKPELGRSLDTPIQGSGSELDSLGLINFVVAVEENVDREFGVPITLADDRALSLEPSPFESIGALAEYVGHLIREGG
jgi:acyl carrier protein